jgi:nucleoside phosphorylase
MPQEILRAVILTALPIEYLAVRTHLTDLREEINSQKTIYERGRFAANGREWEVGIAELSMGTTNSAAEVVRVIANFKPHVVLFVGVAAGIKDVALGDVVVSNRIYGYEHNKAEQSFSPKPEIWLGSYGIEQQARDEAKKSDWLERLPPVPSPPPKVYFAPIVFVDQSIRSNRSEVLNFLHSNYKDALAVGMEGYGFFQEVEKLQYPAPIMVVQGIADLIATKNQLKSDQWETEQEQAAQHASAASPLRIRVGKPATMGEVG